MLDYVLVVRIFAVSCSLILRVTVALVLSLVILHYAALFSSFRAFLTSDSLRS